MDLPSLLYVLRWIVVDTFLQTVAGKVFWILLGCSAIAIIFCLGVSVEGGVKVLEGYPADRTGADLVGPNPHPGTLRLLFGAMQVPIARGEEQEVQMIEVTFATWVAGTVGLLLTLVLTAGFLPESLHPSSASVLLAKPVPRWAFLLGKYLGVVMFVLLQASIFFLGTWTALGLKTGVWNAGYLAGIPLLVIEFAGLFAFSVLLATLTRSTVGCVLGALLFWAVCFGINYGRHVAVAMPHLQADAHISPLTYAMANAGYWLLPKPADTLLVLEDALDAGRLKVTLSSMGEFAAVREHGEFDPLLSLLSTIGFIAVVLGISAHQLGRAEY